MEENNIQQTKKATQGGNISRKGYLWVIGIFTLVGVTGGYLYYALVGCNIDGGCVIQSNPYFSVLWGGALGYLLPDMVLKPREE